MLMASITHHCARYRGCFVGIAIIIDTMYTSMCGLCDDRSPTTQHSDSPPPGRRARIRKSPTRTAPNGTCVALDLWCRVPKGYTLYGTAYRREATLRAYPLRMTVRSASAHPTHRCRNWGRTDQGCPDRLWGRWSCQAGRSAGPSTDPDPRACPEQELIGQRPVRQRHPSAGVMQRMHQLPVTGRPERGLIAARPAGLSVRTRSFAGQRHVTAIPGLAVPVRIGRMG